jgi:hypothetical protein
MKRDQRTDLITPFGVWAGIGRRSTRTSGKKDESKASRGWWGRGGATSISLSSWRGSRPVTIWSGAGEGGAGGQRAGAAAIGLRAARRSLNADKVKIKYIKSNN